MREPLAILAMVAGLGTLISCSYNTNAQGNPSAPAPATAFLDEVGPFERYLALDNAHRYEAALTRFANTCGIKLASAEPKYAQRPGETWIIVPNLSKTKDDIATDLYSTIEVWRRTDRVLVERWGMSLDTGDLFRSLVCLDSKQTTLASTTRWSFAGFGDAADDVSWGFEHLWKQDKSGNLETIWNRFIDLEEKPMTAPKLSAQTLKDLRDAKFSAKTWADLALPDELLQ